MVSLDGIIISASAAPHGVVEEEDDDDEKEENYKRRRKRKRISTRDCTALLQDKWSCLSYHGISEFPPHRSLLYRILQDLTPRAR